MLVDKTQGIEQFAKPKLLVIAWSVFFIGLFLTLIASTDLFSHRPEGMGALWVIHIAAFYAVFKFTLFYLKHRKRLYSKY